MGIEQTTIKEALRAMREREAAMSKVLMAFIVVGLVFGSGSTVAHVRTRKRLPGGPDVLCGNHGSTWV